MDFAKLPTEELRAMASEASRELLRRGAAGAPGAAPPPAILELAFESVSDGVLALDDRGRILFANPAMALLVGRPLEDFKGRRPEDLWAESETASPAGDPGSSRETQLVRPDGSTRVAIRKAAEPSGDPPIAIRVYRDITRRRRAEEALRRREEFYRHLVEDESSIVLVADADGIARYASPSLLSLLGRGPEGVLGHPAAEVFDGDSVDACRDLLDDAPHATHRVMQTGELALRGAIGQLRYFAGAIRNLLADPVVRGYVFNLRDVSDRHLADERLRERDELLAVSMRTSVAAILVLDEQGRTTFANDRAEQVLRAPREALLGEPIDRAVSFHLAPGGERLDDARLPFRGLVRQRVPFEAQRLWVVPADGASPVAVSINGAPLGAGGEARGAILVLTDITQRLLLEAELRYRLYCERQLSECSRLLFHETRDSPLERVLAVVRATVGASRAHLVSNSPETPDPGFVAACAPSVDAGSPVLPDAFRDGGVASGPGRTGWRDALAGQGQWSSDRSPADAAALAAAGFANAFHAAVRVEHAWWGTLAAYFVEWDPRRAAAAEGFLSAAADLLGRYIERRQALDSLRLSEVRFRTLVDRLHIAIILTERGRVLYANQAYERIWGRPAGPLYEDPETFLDSVHRDDRPGLVARRDAFVGRPAEAPPMRYRILRPDGEVRWIATMAFPIEDPASGEGRFRTVNLCEDITEQHHAEGTLRASEERYRLLAEAAEDIIYQIRLRPDLRIDYLGPAFERITGWNPDSLLGQPDALDPVLPDEDRAAAWRYLARARRSPAEATFRMRRPDGTLVWFEHRGAPLVGADGSMVVHGIARDISARLAAEEERREMEAAILHSQKLESLGVLAGGIAHDFNNLLASLMGNAGLALLDLPPDSPAEPSLRKVEATALRMAELTRQMLAYSGRGRFEVRRLDLNEFVSELASLLAVSIDKRVELVLEVYARPIPIEADAAQLNQVVLNLVTNASEAIGGGEGRVVVRTGVRDCQVRDLGPVPWAEHLVPGPYGFVEVEDNGEGMDPETLGRIFEPFFTTKFQGRGLGLAALQGIMRAHRGGIAVQSRRGEGTRFRVYYPLAEAAIDPAAKEPSPDLARSSAGRLILVAEDEPEVLAVADRILARCGHDRLLALDGREALDLFAAHGESIDLVLLDLTMPRIDGVAVARGIRAANPSVPIILTSGYSEDETLGQFEPGAVQGFLAKPYKPRDLSKLVDSLLGGDERSSTTP